MTSIFLTVSEACRRLKIGRTYFYKLIGSGEIRALKVGKKTLVTEEEIQRWISALPDYEPASLASRSMADQ